MSYFVGTRKGHSPVVQTVTHHTHLPMTEFATVVSFCLFTLRRTYSLTRYIHKFPGFHGWCRPNAFPLFALQPEHEGSTTLQLQIVGTLSPYTVHEPTGPSLNTLHLGKINSTFRTVVMFVSIGLQTTFRTGVYVSKPQHSHFGLQ